jgi:LmbE family N-acetylglucosaminyl deacetylase
MPEADVARILVITAHPDDVDFGMGGSVATWTDTGIHVAYCVVTDGDAGGFDPDLPRSQIPAIRRAEQEAAARIVGVDTVHWLGYPDGRLVPSLELRRDLARVIRIERPDRVVGQSPERNWERLGASHPDHLAAGEATVCAVYPDARNPFAFPDLLVEGFEAHVVRELWIMGFTADAADAAVDITDTFERKLAALRCHVSQHTSGPELERRIRAWAANLARAAGLPDGRLAEVFRVVAAG